MDKNVWSVYVHTNNINNKRYIGITSREYPTERWGKDGSGYESNTYFTNSIKKYGWSNFSHDIIFKKLTKEQACKIEIDLISTFNTRDREFGYNIASGGQSGNTGDDVYILSVAREKKFIEKYNSVKDCIHNNISNSKCKGKTLRDVLYARNKIVIKVKYIDPILNDMEFNSSQEEIVYFNEKGDILITPLDGELNQVVRLWVSKGGKIKIEGIGFTDGKLDGRVVHTKPLFIKEKSRFDDFIVN